MWSLLIYWCCTIAVSPVSRRAPPLAKPWCTSIMIDTKFNMWYWHRYEHSSWNVLWHLPPFLDYLFFKVSSRLDLCCLLHGRIGMVFDNPMASNISLFHLLICRHWILPIYALSKLTCWSLLAWNQSPSRPSWKNSEPRFKLGESDLSVPRFKLWVVSPNFHGLSIINMDKNHLTMVSLRNKRRPTKLLWIVCTDFW
jgi:hypothetical protein